MRRPGISRISKAHPAVDEHMFTVFSRMDTEQPGTRAPPLTGLVDDKTDLEEYDYHYQANKNKKKSKAATAVPVVEQDHAGETDASEPTDNLMNFSPTLPLPPSAYLDASPRHPSFPLAYEDRGISVSYPESSTNASHPPTMYHHQGWRTGGGSSGGGGGVGVGMVRPISLPPQFHGQPAMSLPLPLLGEPAYPALPSVASSMHGNAPAPSSLAAYVAPSPVTYAPSRDRAAEDGASTTRMGSGRASARRRRQPPTRRAATNRGQPPTSTTARYKPYPLDGLQPQGPVPALRHSQVRAEQFERVSAAPAYAYSVPAGPPWAPTSTSPLEEEREAGVAIPPGYYITPHGQPEAAPRGANVVYPYPTEVATYSNIPRAVLDQTRTAPIWTSGPSSSASPSSSSSFFSGAPVSDSVVTAASQLPQPAVYGEHWSPTDADVGSAQAQLRAMMDPLHNGGHGGPSASQPRRP